jgi:hypothetical protein
MLASGIKGIRVQLRSESTSYFRLYAAAPRMPRLLAAGCAAAISLYPSFVLDLPSFPQDYQCACIQMHTAKENRAGLRALFIQGEPLKVRAKLKAMMSGAQRNLEAYS